MKKYKKPTIRVIVLRGEDIMSGSNMSISGAPASQSFDILTKERYDDGFDDDFSFDNR